MSEDTTTTPRHWRLERRADRLAWLCLDRAGTSTNTLSTEVMAELGTVLAGLERDPPEGLVIWSAKDKGFIAGADVREFPQLTAPGQAHEVTRRGQQLLARLESLPCPSVAVINGHALGGGLELAMACRARLAIAGDKPTIGLPEVQLGLHPGFGGTIRAVQLAGVRAGLKLMLTGKPVTPTEALRLGLVDRVVPAAGWEQAAAALVRQPPAPRRMPLLDRLLSMALLRPRVAARLRRETAARAAREHYPAPFAIIDLWEQHGASPTPEAFEAEAQSFGDLSVTATSRNLVRVFFLQERLKHLGEARAPVQHVHVVGAGIMGGDIAAWCALRGLEVTLQDREERFVTPALERASRLFDKRLPDAEARAQARGRLRADLAGDGVADADVVIEAIFEDLGAKQELFERVQQQLKSGAIMASNTSSIPLQDLAAALAEPDRLVGLHFFNPVARLPLVEVVVAPETSESTRHQAIAFARQIGKLPLPCQSRPGFLVNRILAPYMAEAMELAREGVPLAEIDQVARDFGMPMGPIELADSVGLDVALHVARILAPVIGRPVAAELESLVAAGRLGAKSGQGFYTWAHDKPVKPELTGSGTDAGVRDRLVLALLNEAAACLHEGIVEDADLLDAGVIFGTGFAPFRGGPLHHAQTEGIDSVVARLDELTEQHGLRFRPSPGWEQVRRLAASS